MEEDIFEGVTSQYIDIYGKCRILNYSNLSLVISPISPLDVKQTTEVNPKLASSQQAVEFIEKKTGAQIKKQDGSEEMIQGIWIEHPSFQFAYIPVKLPVEGDETNAIKDVEFANVFMENPIYTDDHSKLDDMRRNKLIAFYLKEYSMILFSKNKSIVLDNFKIMKNHDYDIYNMPNKIGKHENIFYEEKLIVPDQETADKLIKYVNVNVYNDRYLIDKYSELKIINSKREYDPSEFNTTTDELIFSNKNQIKNWMKNENEK